LSAFVAVVLLTMGFSIADGGVGTARTVERTSLAFRFGDWQAAGELDYPVGVVHAPVVVLIHGAGAEDMNADIGSGPAPRSHIFADIASYLTVRGYAVLRYNKRYVTGYHRVDGRFGAELDMPTLLADARTVLVHAESDPRIDPRRVYLYGWSEGSVVASALAATRPELAGLILQGPVAESWHDTVGYQIDQVTAAYLRGFAIGGKLGPSQLRRAYASATRTEELWMSGICPRWADGDYTVSGYFDPRRTGELDVDADYLPRIHRYLDTVAFAPGGPMSMYGPARHTLPTVLAQARGLTMAVLIVQGMSDGNVPPAGAAALRAALRAYGNHDTALRLFPGLGHSLGPAPDAVRDDFRPIAVPALAAIADWLDRHRQTT
jgi:pimeloyl-ACP methyl ester carboxylesterase